MIFINHFVLEVIIFYISLYPTSITIIIISYAIEMCYIMKYYKIIN